MGEGAASELGGPRHQEGIRRRADADHEDARAPAHGADGLEQLLLVADLTVGEENHLADDVGLAAAPVGQRRLHRRHHLGAAARLERRHECLGLRDVLGIGRHRVGEQHVHGVVEADDVEAVGGREPAERIDQARLGLHDRGAAHGAGIVDDEDDLARAPLARSARHRRRRHEGEQVVGVADALAEQADRRRGAFRRLPGQLEIAVGRHRAVGKLDDADAVLATSRSSRRGGGSSPRRAESPPAGAP